MIQSLPYCRKQAWLPTRDCPQIPVIAHTWLSTYIYGCQKVIVYIYPWLSMLDCSHAWQLLILYIAVIVSTWLPTYTHVCRRSIVIRHPSLTTLDCPHDSFGLIILFLIVTNARPCLIAHMLPMIKNAWLSTCYPWLPMLDCHPCS